MVHELRTTDKSYVSKANECQPKARLTQTCQARTFCQDLARTPRTPRFFHCRQSPRCFGQTNMQMKVSWCSRGHVWDMSPTYFRGVK